MKALRILAGSTLAVLAFILWTPTEAANEAPFSPIPCCKPSAPVTLEIHRAVRAAGGWQVEFTATPTLDVMSLDVAARASGEEPGPSVSFGSLSEAAVVSGRATASTNRTDSILQLTATLTFDPGDGFPIERATTTQSISVGDPVAALEPDLPIVMTNGTASYEVPAIRDVEGGR